MSDEPKNAAPQESQLKVSDEIGKVDAMPRRASSPEPAAAASYGHGFGGMLESVGPSSETRSIADMVRETLGPETPTSATAAALADSTTDKPRALREVIEGLPLVVRNYIAELEACADSNPSAISTDPIIRISQNAQFVLDSRNSILSYEASGALQQIIKDAREVLDRVDELKKRADPQPEK